MIDSFSGEYAFLSNGHPCFVCYEGEPYPTVEHAYQAAKTLDLDWRYIVRDAPKPFGIDGAKRIGRRVPLRKDWEEIKLDVMLELCLQKFADSLLKAQLLATGDEELVEGNYWNDTFWGVCDGEGENHLGKILMEIRNHYESSPTQDGSKGAT